MADGGLAGCKVVCRLDGLWCGGQRFRRAVDVTAQLYGAFCRQRGSRDSRYLTPRMSVADGGLAGCKVVCRLDGFWCGGQRFRGAVGGTAQLYDPFTGRCCILGCVFSPGQIIRDFHSLRRGSLSF